MVSADRLNSILKTLDAGGTVAGWTLKEVKETYYLTSQENGVTWVREGRGPWRKRRSPD